MNGIRTLGIATALLFTLVGCSTTSTPDSQGASGVALPDGLNPEPGTDIPSITLKLGITPVADEIIPVIGERLGYFDEVGITFSEPNGIQANLIESFTPLLNGQIEVGSGYVPVLFPQMDTVENLRVFANSNVFQGYRILVPEGKYDTVSDLMASGMPYEEAIVQALEPMQGQTFLMEDGDDPSFFNFALRQAGMTLGDTDATYLAGPDIVLAASSGRADFVAPTGAVQIAQLQNAGWEPLIDLDTLLDYTPHDDTVNLRGGFSGYLTTTEYAEENYNALLRFTGVIYRIIDLLEADPLSAVAIYSDYVNSYTGASLTDEEIVVLFAEGGPYGLFNFEDADAIYHDPEENHNVELTTNARLANFLAEGVLVGEFTIDDASIAARVYDDLVMYQTEAQKLLDEAPDNDLAAQAAVLMEQRNYLDAYRFAKAAVGE